MYQNFKKREIFSKISQKLHQKKILILIGPRQVGKTILLKMTDAYLQKNEPDTIVLYFDLEKPDLLAQFTDYSTIIQFLLAQGAHKDKKNIILLDEFQHIPTPTKTLKILHDNYPYLQFIVSGSSSLDIHNNLREESLVGRKQLFIIWPLDFIEWLDFSGEPDAQSIVERLEREPIDPSPMASMLVPLYENFTIWGGYPGVVINPAIDDKLVVLEDIYSSYLQRDVAGLIRREDSASFIKLAVLLAGQIGNLCNVRELGKLVGIERHRLETFLFVLQHTYIIMFLTPYHTNKQKELVKMPKVFFVDTGLRNTLLNNFNQLAARPDMGNLIENSVVMELKKHLPPLHTMHFWRTPQGTEVDIVIKSGQHLVPIEVKYQPMEKPTVPSGMKAFIKQYQPSSAYVLTKSYADKIVWEGCTVTFLPVFLATKIIGEL